MMLYDIISIFWTSGSEFNQSIVWTLYGYTAVIKHDLLEINHVYTSMICPAINRICRGFSIATFVYRWDSDVFEI